MPWVQLFKLYSKKELSSIKIAQSDDYERSNLVDPLTKRLRQIDQTDYMEYHDVFNPESTSFKYTQGCNEFRFRYQVSLTL